MKKLLYLSILPLLIFSCGEGNEELASVEAKQARIKELQAEIGAIQEEIGELQKEVNDATGVDPEAKFRKVVVEPVNVETFNHFIEVQGNVESDKNVSIVPEAQGIITKKYVEEGQKVRAGQPIVALDASLIKKTIDEVDTRLDLAVTLYERQKRLYEQNVGTEVQYLQAKNNMEALQKQMANLKTQLSKTIVKSPITGTLDQLFSNVGEMASPTMPVARIVNLDNIKVKAEISERYLNDIKPGDQAVVKFPIMDKEVETDVNRVGQYINPANRSFEVTLLLNNKDGSLRPNVTAEVQLNDYKNTNAIVVPSNVIQQSTSGDKFLYAIDGGEKPKVQKKSVKIGKSYRGETEVLEGLNPGDQIIVTGYNEVADGEEVRVQKPSAGLAIQ
jgi:RND family efflux transporter MFP subunit